MGRIFRLTLHGKLRPGIGAQNGTRFPVEPARGNCIPEFACKTGCAFQLSAQGKMHPGIHAQTGTCFPVEPSAESSSRNRGSKWDVLSGWPSNGKSVPELVLRMGRTFRLVLHGKIHPGIPAQNGKNFPQDPPTRPRQQASTAST